MEGSVYRGKAAYERWLREELPEVWEDFRGEDLEFRSCRTGACCCSATSTAAAAQAAPRCGSPSASWRGSGTAW